MDRNFRKMLEEQWARGKFVCVGLDSEYGKIPAHLRKDDIYRGLLDFNEAIVDATKDIACAYKPNAAFYEMHGTQGVTALAESILYVRTVAPEVPVILDFKRGDIGNTNDGYVAEAFTYYQADAVTVNPYLGREALKPFLDREDKGIIVVCCTSNPGGGEFQRIPVIPEWMINGSIPLYQYVARRVFNEWNRNGNCALVVGAPYPDDLRKVREIVGDMPILIPGVGFQQKNVPIETQVEQVVSAGGDSRWQGMIINSSRGIIFASSGTDFAEAARRETLKLHDLINQYRRKEKKP